MRIKVLIPALIILLAALAIVFLGHPHQPMANSGPTTGSTFGPTSITGNGMSGSQNLSAAASSVEPSPTQKLAAVDRLNPEKIRDYMESQNQPIDFFGQVIDQDSNTITGAVVKGEVLHLKVITPVPGGDADETIPIDQKTDAGGRFEIQGMTGRALQIESIQKDGYEVEPGNCPHNFGTPVGSYENPVLFKMWSVNAHEQLITGNRSFGIVPDGRPYFINLTDGTISESPSGDLKVWIQNTSQAIHGQLYDWSAGIEVISGGLLEEGIGSAMDEAPTDGYAPSFQLQQQIKGGQRGEIGQRQFYLQLKNGQKYGQISIDLIAPFNDQTPGLVTLSYAVNPSGSRRLY